MKKLMLAIAALVMLCACSSERGYLDYRGLSMAMSAKSMCDSLMARGFYIDSASTDSGSSYVLASNQEKYRISIYYSNDTISDIVENYTASTMDSTSRMWQDMHDQMEKDVCRPYMTHRADLHKEAVYQTDKGTITLILMNRSIPTVDVRYSTQITY